MGARRRPLRLGAALVAIATSLGVVVALAPAWAANPPTPGNYTGLGFDQCQAPSQRAMNVWKRKSPFSAVGIYISGNSRFCRDQVNLDRTWVRKQIANGWHLLPITLGPQASCSTRFPRYGASIDPTIRPSKKYTYAKARAQGRQEADRAVTAAKGLGIVPGSTLFYDIEGWSLNVSTRCNRSALWFLSAWSNQLHLRGYLSGVYSSVGSGIKILDNARKHPPRHYVGPDMIWLARWDNQKNTSATQYISDRGWSHHQRVKQYQGGHNETHGGVRINIDRNYVDLRSRPVPKHVAGPPNRPAPHPQDTSKCTRESISRPSYRWTTPTKRKALVLPAQCLLTQHGLYHPDITGVWDAATTQAIGDFRDRLGRRPRPSGKVGVSRRDWISLLTIGASGQPLRAGATGPDAIRVQRAMNAAGPDRLRVTGRYNKATRAAVKRWKTEVFGGKRHSATIGKRGWKALYAGRWR